MAYTNGYRAYLQKEDVSRVQLRVPKEIVDAIDNFGIPKGFRSRNAAIIYLIERGLADAKKAPEHGLGNRSDASKAE
ncbi:hypothetical protein NBRC3280_3370 [Acetobacter pasteurianus NBRC 3280]|uniref:Ribbon-helix-helix protein CopG domain-containing protein n=1 Tax=Acetobacter pasteurianus NBRC 3278 TaxID=1226660 RepID=A0A401X9J8_ACEPA|nr:ribbon-helix-helix domain-containing protein [Acetobacter pasteurianus]GCD60804.1 hypothetical protein NBRC3277_3379 [Acetobacter pasteurianus NBRC 3277]GCD64407.1 hypothetical protein NBRC3278_3500 [Acetobacter pasteurianus NBRC 3278]GCD70735.1 hypothetical protein NBRC3280_3370 [Acetobacter pasteurianus NBRC 3280]